MQLTSLRNGNSIFSLVNVADETHMPEDPSEVLFLLRCRVEAIFESADHFVAFLRRSRNSRIAWRIRELTVSSSSLARRSSSSKSRSLIRTPVSFLPMQQACRK